MKDILIVEDNVQIGSLLRDFLLREKYSVTLCSSGEDALDAFETEGAKLVLLDLMLPGIGGYNVLSKIRESSNASIIILSAKTEKDDKLKGLELGADDYIEKPYDVDILLAKVRGLFKRKYAQDELCEGNLRLDIVAKALYVDGSRVEVTSKEFDLLRMLIENKGQTIKKEFLFSRIWGSESESEIHTLAVHIKWLREKIEADPKNPVHLLTVWGVGYRFE